MIRTRKIFTVLLTFFMHSFHPKLLDVKCMRREVRTYVDVQIKGAANERWRVRQPDDDRSEIKPAFHCILLCDANSPEELLSISSRRTQGERE